MGKIYQAIQGLFQRKNLTQIQQAIVNAQSGGGNLQSAYHQTWSVFRAVNIISSKASDVPVLLKRGETELFKHAALDLLNDPCDYLTQKSLIEGTVQNLLLHGEAFWQLGYVSETSKYPIKIYLLPNRSVNVEENAEQVADPIRGYTYNGKPLPMRNVVHFRIPDPSRPWRGVSPLASALDAAELQYLIDLWNKNTLHNGGVPFIQYRVPGSLDENSFTTLRNRLDTGMAGAGNARKIAIAEGGAGFEPLALSPVDMDFSTQHTRSTSSIALAFGLDPIMLGVNAAQKYSNYQEARRAMMQDAVLPHCERIWASISKALLESGMSFEIDYDSIPELQEDMKQKADALNAAGCLTLQERREAFGYDPEWDGDLLVPMALATAEDVIMKPDNTEL